MSVRSEKVRLSYIVAYYNHRDLELSSTKSENRAHISRHRDTENNILKMIRAIRYIDVGKNLVRFPQQFWSHRGGDVVWCGYGVGIDDDIRIAIAGVVDELSVNGLAIGNSMFLGHRNGDFVGVVWCGHDVGNGGESRIAIGGVVEGIGDDGLIIGGSLLEVYIVDCIVFIFVSVVNSG